jgi:hypothetical protein
LAHFDQLQLAPKFGRYRLKSNPLCLASHRGSEPFGAFDLIAQVVGVGHGCRSLVRFTTGAQYATHWSMTLVKTAHYADGTRTHR